MTEKKETQKERIERLEADYSKLLRQVANLAKMLDDHMKEPDAHHTAMLAKKKK